jgi:glucose uptake protein
VFALENQGIAILLCVLTMIGWGSWANTQKFSERDRWPFPLFYWDYALGVFVLALIAALTLGLAGEPGTTTIANFVQAAMAPMFHALVSGILFNVANLLLVVAIDYAGMSVAFPIGIGLALVIGTIASYFQAPNGNPSLIADGVVLVVLAMIFSAISYGRMQERFAAKGVRGLLFAVIAGCLMGLFYPQLSSSISAHFNTGSIAPGGLTPYTALLLFSVGLLLSNTVINTIFMRFNKIGYACYFRRGPKVHLWGLLGGMIWMVALTCNVIASGVSGPAISYALGQGATLVAALWGVFVWREFRNAPAGTWKYVAMTLLSYALGLTLIGAATFH